MVKAEAHCGRRGRRLPRSLRRRAPALFTFRRRNDPAGTVLVLIAALTHMICLDKRKAVADVTDIRLNGISSSEPCQFLERGAGRVLKWAKGARRIQARQDLAELVDGSAEMRPFCQSSLACEKTNRAGHRWILTRRRLLSLRRRSSEGPMRLLPSTLSRTAGEGAE